MKSPRQSPKLPPGPRSRIPGAILRLLRKGPLEFLTKLTRDYGDISSFRAAAQTYIIINSPDLAQEILQTRAGGGGGGEEFWKGPALQNSKGILGEGLLTAEGDAHRRPRKLMQPAFHAKHVETYSTQVLSSTNDLVNKWKKSAITLIDIRPEMMALTLVISGRALFGTILDSDIQTVHRCMNDLMNNYRRAVVPWGKFLNYLPLPSTRRLIRARRDLIALVDRIIKDRRQEIEMQKVGETTIENQKSKIKNPPDLLTMMIAATDEESPNAPGCPMHGGGATSRMTDTQLRDQSVTILTASHETTANALTFTLYLLAKHPDEQNKLRLSLSQNSAFSTQPSALRNVLSESMRLYPPAWTLGRQNQAPLTLGTYHIPKKSTILIPQWTLHRDPRFFPDPLAFNPDRWQSASHPRFAYLPFSTGTRNCIGESFAWLEMQLALQLLLKNFHFSLPKNSPELKLIPAITLRPKNPVLLQIRPIE